jgi:uncharacterized membrane protein
MNTVFKVYYKLWILLALAAAVGWSWILHHRSSLLMWTGRLSLVIPVLGLVYAARLTGTAVSTPPQSLDAAASLPPGIRETVQSASPLIRPGDLIVEAPGDSYRADHSILGTWTSGANPVGWSGHQSQWRPGTPQPDPRPLYTAPAEADLLMAVWDLQADWVLLGPREQERYAPSAEWRRWMDLHFNRVVNTPEHILWGPMGHELLKR